MDNVQVPVKISKWKDPAFLRKYYRERRREERGLKRHPNVLDDGSLWSEHNPWGQFSSHREKLDAMAKYRTLVPKRECEMCGGQYYETQHEKHQKTKKHLVAIDLLKKHNVVLH